MNSILLSAMLSAFLTAEPPAEEKSHSVVGYLVEKVLENILDDKTRFGLGASRILTSFKHLSKGLYNHGFMAQYAQFLAADNAAMKQLYNPSPKPINVRQAGDLIRQFIRELEAAEEILAKISNPEFKLRVPVGRLLAEFHKPFGENPLFWMVTLGSETQAPVPAATPEGPHGLVIAFDKADVTWLRGYCHILLAISETIVACDWKEWFDRSAHLFFPKVDGAYPFLAWQPPRINNLEDAFSVFEQLYLIIPDIMTALARADAPVTEPERLKKAHQHLLTALALSRQTWKEIQAETDNDAEWIPGPHQESVIGTSVSKEMVETWLKMLDELEAILKGEVLLPFWRGEGDKGINLKRVFYESKRISLVDWLQGVAAVPFLEHGPIAEGTIWTNLFDAFGDNFFNYAVWFN